MDGTERTCSGCAFYEHERKHTRGSSRGEHRHLCWILPGAGVVRKSWSSINDCDAAPPACEKHIASGDLIPRAEHDAAIAAEREKVAALVEAATTALQIFSHEQGEYPMTRHALAAALDALRPTESPVSREIAGLTFTMPPSVTCPTCGGSKDEPRCLGYHPHITDPHTGDDLGPQEEWCTHPFHGEGSVTK